MKKSLKFDKKYLIYLASLSLLTLTEQEIKSLITKLEETVKYIDNINAIQTDSTSPTYQTGDLRNIFFKDGEKNQRKLSQDEVFKNSRNKSNNYFITKKII